MYMFLELIAIRQLEQHVTYNKKKINVRQYLHHHCHFIADKTILYSHSRDDLCPWTYELSGCKGNREKDANKKDNFCFNSSGCQHIKFNSEDLGVGKMCLEFLATFNHLLPNLKLRNKISLNILKRHVVSFILQLG